MTRMRTLLSRRDLLTLGQGTSASAGEPIVHIASLLLQATPSGIENVREVIAGLPGAELHSTANPAKIAVVLETGNEQALAQATDALSQVPGVLTVSIVAHLMEQQSRLDNEVVEASA